MISYSQNDSRWSKLYIGSSSYTFGRAGCTLTCICDLASYWNLIITPADILKYVSVTSGGLVIWSTCNFDNFKFSRRVYVRNDREILKALRDPDRAVILQVNKGKHWVVASGWDSTTGLFKIADPWLGDRATMARYGNDITGCAYFESK